MDSFRLFCVDVCVRSEKLPCPSIQTGETAYNPSRKRCITPHPLYRNDTKHAATSHTRLPCHAVSTTSLVPTLHGAETWCRVEMTSNVRRGISIFEAGGPRFPATNLRMV